MISTFIPQSKQDQIIQSAQTDYYHVKTINHAESEDHTQSPSKVKQAAAYTMNKKSEYISAHHKQETQENPPIHSQQTVKHSAHSTDTKTLKSLGGTSGVRKQQKIQVTTLLIEATKICTREPQSQAK